MASESGGMDIEEVAEKTPDKVLRVNVDVGLGLMPYQGRRLAYGLNVGPKLVRPVADLLANLYRVYENNDCSLAEINPLVITTDGRVIAADAKLAFDDDALFRHRDIMELRDTEQEDPLEAQAGEFGISYVKLDGDVGCMVNGAGLAMATMDVTVAAGASPANFLDVGGSADEEKVRRAVTIIQSDPSVRAIFVNIFGGILRCDVVARGILMAAEAEPGEVRPMVVRMLGTNAEEGRALLAESSLDVALVVDLAEAAGAVKEVK
jgi:succinyl-CoA synthetase beta subunit